MKHFSMEPVDFPDRSCAHVFELSVQRKSPFKDKDVGFQDTVILLSVIDHLQREKGHIAAFISGDTHFSKHEVAKAAESVGVHIDLYNTVDEVAKLLEGKVLGRAVEEWRREGARVAAAMKARLEELEGFIRDNLSLSEWDLKITGSLVLVQKIEAIDVTKAYTPLDFDRKDGTNNVDVSFEVETRLEVVVDSIQFPDPHVFTVGSEPARPLYLPHREVLVCPLTVVVNATAMFEGGEYKDIRFVSVAPRRTLEELLAVNRVRL